MSRSRLSAALVGGAIILNGWAVPAHAAVRCYGRTATIVGTAGNDILRGTQRADVIVARDGRDIIRGLGGTDRICGGQGEDLIYGGGARDRLTGYLGRDKVYGGPGNDHIEGDGDRRPDWLRGKAATTSSGTRASALTTSMEEMVTI